MQSETTQQKLASQQVDIGVTLIDEILDIDLNKNKYSERYKEIISKIKKLQKSVEANYQMKEDESEIIKPFEYYELQNIEYLLNVSDKLEKNYKHELNQ